jgi:hypothetical protein
LYDLFLAERTNDGVWLEGGRTVEASLNGVVCGGGLLESKRLKWCQIVNGGAHKGLISKATGILRILKFKNGRTSVGRGIQFFF